MYMLINLLSLCIKSACFEPVSSQRYKLACALIEDLKSELCTHIVRSESLLGVLWVGKGPNVSSGGKLRLY